MTMTKKELVTLIREDMRYQRHELDAVKGGMIKINDITYHRTPLLKLRFNSSYVDICYKQNGIHISIAHVFFDNINSIGYKYSNRAKIERRLAELSFDNRCSVEV